ncbi:DUF3017 domain-containing protein [Jatrophihabitans sp. YIM 134969]
MTTPPAPVGPEPRAGRLGFGLAMVAVVAGLVYLGVAPQHWLRGVLAVAGGVVFAGFVRLALPDRRAGPLAVRGRWFDAGAFLAVGGLMAVFGFLVK